MSAAPHNQSPGTVLIGYLAREVVSGDEYRSRAATQDLRIHEICSVSTCISPAFKDFDRWAFNEVGYYPTEHSALDAVPQDRMPGAVLFAYRLYSVEFAGGEGTAVPIGDLLGSRVSSALATEPPARFRSIGFDAVSGQRAVATSPPSPLISFGLNCSPLSCCTLSDRYPINSSCLLPEYDDAAAAARDFSRDEPEPGPYYIVQVLRAVP